MVAYSKFTEKKAAPKVSSKNSCTNVITESDVQMLNSPIEISNKRKQCTKVSFNPVMLQITPDSYGSSYVESKQTYLPLRCLYANGERRREDDLVPDFAANLTFPKHNLPGQTIVSILKNTHKPICRESEDNSCRTVSSPIIKVRSRGLVPRQPKSQATIVPSDRVTRSSLKASLEMAQLQGDTSSGKKDLAKDESNDDEQITPKRVNSNTRRCRRTKK